VSVLSISSSIRTGALVLLFGFACLPLARGADPKISRASHQAAAPEPRVTVNSANDDDAYSPQWPEPPNTGAMLLRLFGGTVIVLGLCVGSLWFGKPWLQKLKVAGAGSPSLYVESSVAVGNRAMLYLVRVGDTQLVAGTDASGLKSLIALPTSFKDVLDEQTEPSDQGALSPIGMTGMTGLRPATQADPKE